MLDLFAVPTLVATIVLAVSLLVWWLAVEWVFRPYKTHRSITSSKISATGLGATNHSRSTSADKDTAILSEGSVSALTKPNDHNSTESVNRKNSAAHKTAEPEQNKSADTNTQSQSKSAQVNTQQTASLHSSSNKESTSKQSTTAKATNNKLHATSNAVTTASKTATTTTATPTASKSTNKSTTTGKSIQQTTQPNATATANISTTDNSKANRKHGTTNNNKTDTSGTVKNQTKPKYQTAAKAKSPSARNEASIQISDPSVRHTVDAALRNAATRKEDHSIQTKPHTASNLFASTHAAAQKGSSDTTNKTSPTKQSDGPTVVELKPQNKVSINDRRQSSIELAMAKQTSPQSQTPTAQTDNQTGKDTTDATKANAENSAAGSAEPTTTQNTQNSKAATPANAQDADSALRAELEVSKQKVAKLQTTLNKAQHQTASAISAGNGQAKPHNRPTLLSKVRVLDSTSV